MEAPTTSHLMVLMFTDLVGSVDLKMRLGNAAYIGLIARHDRILKGIVKSLPGAAVLKDTGDGFLVAYATASDGVRAALRFQWAISSEPWKPEPIRVRVGLHIGEVAHLEDTGPNPKLIGLAADFAARIMDLAEPGQILMTRTVFDDARQYLEKHPPVDDQAELPELKWMAHGLYRFKGGATPIRVFEVGAVGVAPLCKPSDGPKARSVVADEDEEDLHGWRAAVGAKVPGRDGWVLERKLDAAAADSWIALHTRTGATHFFKFCYDAEQRSAFKKETKLFRMLQATLGDRDDIVQLHEVRLDEPPYFLETRYTKGGNLAEWAERRGGLSKTPLADRIEIVAATAEAVGAAHSVGVIHKNLDPVSILIQQRGDGPARPCLTDFGIGGLSDPLPPAEDPRASLYAPPETLLGHAYTPQGDVYALGVLLYQMVVGDFYRPLRKGWADGIEDRTLRSDIAVCVQRKPDRRLATATDLAQRLRDLDRRRRARASTLKAREEKDADGDTESGSASGATPFVKLRCGEHTGQEGKILTLVGRRFTFGRENVTVEVPGRAVSRLHAELKLGPRGWVLRDLKSHNGTLLNGERIETARIRVGNTAVLGAYARYTVIALEDGLTATGQPDALVRRNKRVLWAAGIAAVLLAGIVFWPGDPAAEERAAGRAALARCAWPAAASAFERLIALGDPTGDDHLGLAAAKIGMKDSTAERALNNAGRILGASDVRVLLARARFAWQVKRDVPAALEHIGAAAVADAESIEPLMLRVRLLLSVEATQPDVALPRDRLAMVESDVTALERRAHRDARTVFGRGRLLAAGAIEGDLASMLANASAAAERLQEAARLDERWAEPLIEAARVLSSVTYHATIRGRADEARGRAREAMALANVALQRVRDYPHHRCQGTHRAWYLETRGLVRMQGGNYDEAVDDIRAAYTERKDLSAFRRLANTLRRSGHLDEAIQLYLRLTEATQDRTAWFDLGYCFQQKGRTHESASEWRLAREAYKLAIEAYDTIVEAGTGSFVDLAYRGETYQLLAELPGSNREAWLTRAGKDFDAARETAPVEGITEIEHRRVYYLCARGRVEKARGDLYTAITREKVATPATNARYARVLLCCAAKRHVAGKTGEVAALLVEAQERADHAAGMMSEPTAGIAVLQTQVAIARGLLAPSTTDRTDALATANARAASAFDLGVDLPPWTRDGLWLLRAMVDHLRRAGNAAEALTDRLVADLAAGRHRITPEAYDLLGALCLARGDTEAARRAKSRATALLR